MHGKWIGQVMGQCETLAVSNLLAHERAILGAEGCCRSLNALFYIDVVLTVSSQYMALKNSVKEDQFVCLV